MPDGEDLLTMMILTPITVHEHGPFKPDLEARDEVLLEEIGEIACR